MTRIFISHSHQDEEIADLLMDFLDEAIALSKTDIRCTSDPNHGLNFSPLPISEQLRNDLKNSGALIVIATIDSLKSPWILFEVGSFWTTDKVVAPIIGPGLSYEELPGPLRGYRGIQIENEDVSDQINELVNQLTNRLKVQQRVTRRRKKKLEAFISNFREWKPRLPTPDISQQQKIEELTKKPEEPERFFRNIPRGAYRQELEVIETQYREETITVGSFPSNDFGLYDMHGNVWEWCQDDWHDDYEGAPNNGSAWFFEEKKIKVIRGGSWFAEPDGCRSAARYRRYPDIAGDSVGFRVVCTVPST